MFKRLARYWSITVPIKTDAELLVENFCFILPLGNNQYIPSTWLQFKRWHLLLACFTAQLCCGSLYSFVFISDALDLYFYEKITKQNYGTLFRAYIFMGLAAALLGPTLERRGPRASILMATGLVAIGFIISQLAISTKSSAFLTFGYSTFCGMGFGITIISTLTSVQKWYPDLRGITSGLCIVGFNIGNGVFTFVYSRILGRQEIYSSFTDISGVPLIFWRTGLVITIILFLCGLVIRTPPITYSMNGQDIHCVPLNMAPDPTIIQDEYLNIGMTLVNYEIVQHELEGTDGHYFQQVKAMSLLQCIASSDFLFLYFAFATNVIPLLILLPDVVDMGIDVWHLSPPALNRLLIQAFVANTLGRLIAPLISDGLVRLLYGNPAWMRKIVFVGLLIMQMTALGLLKHSQNNPNQVIWYGSILALSSGGGLSIIPCFVSDMFGVYNSGTMYGIILTSYSLGAVVVSYAKGSFHISLESFDTRVHGLFVLVIIGSIFMLFVRTRSKDRFYHGYQYSLCGKVLLQVPFRGQMGEIYLEDSCPVMDRASSPHPPVFTLWDATVDDTLPTKAANEMEAEKWLLVFPISSKKYIHFSLVFFNRWWLLLATLFVHVCSGSIFAFVFIMRDLEQYFHVGGSVSSTPLLLNLYICLGITAAFTGPYIEREGPRIGMFIGTLLVALGYFVSHLAIKSKSLGSFTFGYSILCGAGFGFLLVTSTSATQKWFPDLRATVSGIYMCGFGTGGGIMAKIYADILGRPIFFEGTPRSVAHVPDLYWISGLIISFVLAICCLIIRTPPSSFVVHGLNMHGIPERNAPSSYLVQDEYLNIGMTLVDYTIVQNELDGTDGRYFTQVKAMTLLRCIMSIDFVFVYVAFIAATFPMLLFASELEPIIRGIWQPSNMENQQFAVRVVVLNCLGGLICPLISDGLVRLFYANPAFARKAVFGTLLVLQIIALVLLPQTLVQFIRFQAVACALSFLSGGSFSLIPCFLSDMFGVYHCGTMYGLALTGWSLGAMIVGYIVTNFNGELNGFIKQIHGLVILSAVGLLSLLLVRTQSMDRFYRGCRFSLCGRVLIQVSNSHRNVDLTRGEDSSIAMMDTLKSPDLASGFILLNSDRDEHLV